MDRFERFTLSVFSITRYWNRIAAEAMGRYGLKGANALYLLTLGDAKGEITAAQLAEICQRDKADVSRAIASFQEKGIIEPYGKNRYRAPIVLTPEGRELTMEIRKKARSALLAAGEGLSDEMRGNMYQALDIIAENMRAICEGEVSLGE